MHDVGARSQAAVLWTAAQAVDKPVDRLLRYANGSRGLPTACAPAHSGLGDGGVLVQNNRRKRSALRLKPWGVTVRG